MVRRKNGFTFVELTVVVVIIGIMMAITAPRFSASLSKATLGGAARGLAGTIAYIRNAAARDGRSYFLNLDLDTKQYWVTIINDEADLSQVEYQQTESLDEELYFKEVTDDFLSKKKLEKKIAFEHIGLPDGTDVYDGRVRIEFHPDGTTDEVAIYLTDSRERVYTVYLEHYNGQARVYKYAFVPDPPPALVEREPPRSARGEL